MPAPFKNKFGLGNHRAGRPAKFSTPDDLHQRINEYFNSDESQHPTITGLALYLGFSSRQSLYDYARKEAYSYTIKRALLVIEYVYEKMLMNPYPSGAIFMLKALGWTDKVVQNTNTIINERSSPFSSTKSINQTNH